jgi:hypothetical protein
MGYEFYRDLFEGDGGGVGQCLICGDADKHEPMTQNRQEYRKE